MEVFSEGTLTGERKRTSRAFLTFVAIDRDGKRCEVPPLLLETEAQRQVAHEAEGRRAARLAAKQKLG